MIRPASPLRHDYKPSAQKQPRKTRAFAWFAAGLGVPLAGGALLIGLSTNEPQPVPPVTPAMTSTDSLEELLAEVEAQAMTDTSPMATRAPEPSIDTRYKTLTLTVARGDTMEKLFRRNKRPVRFLAMRFAAKEAVVKAMGTGFANGMWIRDTGFVPDPRGRPVVIFSARGAAVCESLGIAGGHVSLTDEAGLVVAFAVAEKA